MFTATKSSPEGLSDTHTMTHLAQQLARGLRVEAGRAKQLLLHLHHMTVHNIPFHYSTGQHIQEASLLCTYITVQYITLHNIPFHSIPLQYRTVHSRSVASRHLVDLEARVLLALVLLLDLASTK